ncbi:MAG: universal stress protein [Solirubrobacterales bacterium]
MTISGAVIRETRTTSGVRKIVVGFNESEEACDALHLAHGLQAATGGELHVAVGGPPDGPAPWGAEALGDVEGERFERLFSRAEKRLGSSDFIREPMESLSAARGLTELAEQIEADLVVLGSTHRGPFARVFPGSVASRLLEGCPCAVAVAPRGHARRRHFGLGIVGVGYDGSPESEVALRSARQLAAQLGAKVRVITVVPDRPPNGGRDPSVPVLREHMRTALERVQAREGRDLEIILAEGGPAAVLADQGIETDLLVVGSRGYGPARAVLLGDVTAELIQTAPCPVVAVPRGASDHQSQGEHTARLSALR